MELGRFWWWVVLILVQLGMNGCFGCWEHERAALLQLKASINSTADTDYFRTWNSSTNKKSDCCDWERVKCDNTTGHVIQLDLNYTIGWNREDWCLNASLFLPFEELQYLDLDVNWISRWVPNEGFERLLALHKLEMLSLNGNRFNNNILSSLSGISSLKILDLSANELNGSFHIQAFSSLEELNLANNEIDDFVTTKGSNLGKLQVLDLGWNKFSARIFESLSTFPSLKILDLTGNNLEGSFTNEELRALNNLEELYLGGSSIDESFVSKVEVMT